MAHKPRYGPWKKAPFLSPWIYFIERLISFWIGGYPPTPLFGGRKGLLKVIRPLRPLFLSLWIYFIERLISFWIYHPHTSVQRRVSPRKKAPFLQVLLVFFIFLFLIFSFSYFLYFFSLLFLFQFPKFDIRSVPQPHFIAVQVIDCLVIVVPQILHALVRKRRHADGFL